MTGPEGVPLRPGEPCPSPTLLGVLAPPPSPSVAPLPVPSPTRLLRVPSSDGLYAPTSVLPEPRSPGRGPLRRWVRPGSQVHRNELFDPFTVLKRPGTLIVSLSTDLPNLLLVGVVPRPWDVSGFGRDRVSRREWYRALIPGGSDETPTSLNSFPPSLRPGPTLVSVAVGPTGG